MSKVGKKFPSIAVKAMNEMGDTFELNVVEEAIKNGKKVLTINSADDIQN